MFRNRPKLLVSVRSREEARSALQGGADIIDVKEPLRGPLGMAPLEVIGGVVQLAAEPCPEGPPSRSDAVRVSAALGEVVDWERTHCPPLPAGLSFAKMGLSQLADVRDWRGRWESLRRRLDDNAAGGPLRWIAVIYADRQSAHSPAAADILAAAAETGCVGILWDTFQKDAGDLLQWLRLDHLAQQLEQARSCRLITAVAGRLTAELIEELTALPVDVVAVRSAACRAGRRTEPICRKAVGRLSSLLTALSPRFPAEGNRQASV